MAGEISTAVLDDSKWRAQIQALAAALPREFVDQLLKVEAKEYVKKVVSFLPPKTLSQGRKAVATDIGRAIRILDPRTFTDPQVRKLMLSGDVDAIRRYCDNVPGLAGMVVSLFDPSLHTNQRNRYGRVNKGTNPVLVPQPDVVKSYTRKVQDRVGLLKSGYSPAAATLGVSLPQWVKRHSSEALGSVQVVVGQPGGISFVLIVNRSGKYPDHARFARDALASRAESIRTKTLRVLAGKAVNLGFRP